MSKQKISNQLITVILLGIISISIFVRFYKLGSYPTGLNVDEVAFGYNAYSILETGRDENGNFMPLLFESYGDYKPPVYVYLTVLPVKIFGLNEFSVRFMSAILGVATVFVSYFFFTELTENKRTGLLASFLLAISPWHVFYSRLGMEAQPANFLVFTGMYFLYRLSRNGGIINAFIAALLIVASMYTYHSEKLFAPLIVMAFLLISFKKLVKFKKDILVFLVLCVMLSAPLIINFIFGNDSARAETQFMTKDPAFERFIFSSLPEANAWMVALSNKYILMFYYAVRKFLSFFDPQFIFSNGLNLTKDGTLGLGIVYLFELPLVVLGIYSLIYKKYKDKFFIGIWILLGLIPASITIGEYHTIRTLMLAPIASLISAVGAMHLVELLGKQKRIFTISLYVLFTIFASWNLIYAAVVYFKYYPHQRGEWYMEGTREIISYVIENYDKYEEVVFDPSRGLTGPYTIGVPHEYFLFYSKFDPEKYHQLTKFSNEGAFTFDKFTVRHIDWQTEDPKKNILYVGSPWGLPDESNENAEVLKKVYLTNGGLALLAVRTKTDDTSNK